MIVWSDIDRSSHDVILRKEGSGYSVLHHVGNYTRLRIGWVVRHPGWQRERGWQAYPGTALHGDTHQQYMTRTRRDAVQHCVDVYARDGAHWRARA